MIRITKILLICTIFLWGLIGAVKNIMDWDGTLGAVTAATSMATFDGGAQSWQATSNMVVVWVGALFIMLSKLTAAGLCAVGAVQMWKSRNQEAAFFQASKNYALAGCAVAMIMLFGGFVVIAESWFELWRSDVMRGPVLDSAFRYGAMITLIALFVASKED